MDKLEQGKIKVEASRLRLAGYEKQAEDLLAKMYSKVKAEKLKNRKKFLSRSR